MTKHKKTVAILDRQFISKVHELEQMTGDETYNKYGLKRDECITQTVKFDNGYEADIKLVIADGDSYNWTEGILFNTNGQQVALTEPSEDFFGEWYFEDHEGNQYFATIDEP